MSLRPPPPGSTHAAVPTTVKVTPTDMTVNCTLDAMWSACSRHVVQGHRDRPVVIPAAAPPRPLRNK